MPLVSVGMPVYQGERYVASALESLLGQTFGDFEIVISDNDSNDATEEICRQFVKADRRISYRRQPTNVGAAANHNLVFQAARGKYFKWAAYDDLCAPEFLARCVAALETRPEATCAYSQTRLIDDDGAIIGEYTGAVVPDQATASERVAAMLDDHARSVLHFCLPIYGLFRRELLTSSPLIAHYNSSDAALIFNQAVRGPFIEIAEFLFENRKHASSSLANRSSREVAAWFDPAKGTAEPLTRSRLFASYLRSIVTAPLPIAERSRCLAVLGRSGVKRQHFRVIGGELRRWGAERVSAGRTRLVASPASPSESTEPGPPGH